MGALDTAVRQGKALYVGISSYSGQRTQEAVDILRQMGTPLLIHQPSYSMLNAGSRKTSSTCWARTASWCIAFLTARPGHADRQVPQGHSRRFPCRAREVAGPVAPVRDGDEAHPIAQPVGQGPRPVPGADGSRRGCCATTGGPRCSSARRARSSRTAWPARGTSSSRRRSSPRSTGMRSTPASTCGSARPASGGRLARTGSVGGLSPS